MKNPFRFRRLSKKRIASRSRAGNLLILLILLLMGAFSALPLIYSIVSSLKPLDELFAYPPRFFVQRPTASNYTLLFKLVSNMWVPFSRYLFNSLFISVVVTVGSVLISSMAAYPLSKYKLRLGWLFDLVVVSLLFTGNVLWLPQYIVLSRLHIINTYLVYIVPALASAFGMFLMKQFMDKVPFVLIESALIDGASQYRILFRIVMPQVKPAWLTLTVFAFQGIWNTQPMNMVFDEQLKLINMAVQQVISSGISRIGPSMAAGVILMIPPLLVFAYTQSSVIETMASSGIKE